MKIVIILSLLLNSIPALAVINRLNNHIKPSKSMQEICIIIKQQGKSIMYLPFACRRKPILCRRLRVSFICEMQHTIYKEDLRK